MVSAVLLQQYLPFTVLKRKVDGSRTSPYLVATVLTVYGIETIDAYKTFELLEKVATVLTVYGIETTRTGEIIAISFEGCNSTYRLRY